MGSDRVSHPVFAWFYGRLSPRMEPELGPYRDRLLAGLAGEVIEVGAGNGMNFRHYPPTVARVLAVEPEPRLRALAERAAAGAPVPVEVVDGRADRLPAGDGSYDAAVASLVLCSVADPDAALAEMRRVLRRGAQLRYFEHVRAGSGRLGTVQRALDATVWPLAFGGCHTHRDTTAAIRRAGLVIEQEDRFRLPDIRLSLPSSPHVLGTAVRP